MIRSARWTIRLLLFVAWPALGGTTGTLEGNVNDKETGEPMAGVSVIVLGTGHGAVTDMHGHYQIVGIRAGVYDVRYKMIGYRPTLMRRVTILPDFRTQVDVALVPSSVEMEGVEIRAERPLIQKDQTASAFHYDDQDLQSLPITRISESLNFMPGTTPEGNVRGGRVDEVLYVLDGVPLHDAMGGGMLVDMPKSAVSSMTLWTGGFDAEFGNALSGIVNIVSKSATSTPQLHVRYECDHWLPDRIQQQTDHATDVELTASGPLQIGDLSYFTVNNYSGSDTRWWQDFRHFFSSPVRREFTGLTRMEYSPASTTRYVVQGLYSNQRWHDYEFRWRYRLDGLPSRAKDFFRMTGGLVHTISERSFFSVTLGMSSQYSHIGPDTKEELDLLPYQYDLFLRYIVAGSENWWATGQQRTWTLKADYTLQPNSIHTIKAGMEYHLHDVFSDLAKYEPQLTYYGKPIIGAPLLNYSYSYSYKPRMGSVFLQDKMQVEADGSILNIGLRWDFLDPAAERPQIEFIPTRPGEYQQRYLGTVHTSIKQQFSPRFSFSIPTSHSGFVFANYGRYVQFPLFNYLYAGVNPSILQYGAKAVLAGNPDLEPERTAAWEIGVRQQFHRNWMAAATYFKKTTTNQIDTKTLVPFDSKFTGDFGYAAYVNVGEANVSGLELILQYESQDRLKGMLSYTLMDATGMSESADFNVNVAQWGFPIPTQAYPLSWDQRHTLKLSVDVVLPWDISLNVFAEYHSGRPYTFFPTADGYTPLDSTKTFLPNNRRMQDYSNINLRLGKSLRLDPLLPMELEVYADITNLLNTLDVKWMDSNGRVGGELADPTAYCDLRRTRIGVVAKF